jgi:hypothetical protein
MASLPLAGRQERSLASQWGATQHSVSLAMSSMSCRGKAGLYAMLDEAVGDEWDVERRFG